MAPQELLPVERLNEGSVVHASLAESIHDKLSEFNHNADQLLAQAERAVVDSDKTLATAGDLYRVIRGQENAAEDARKSLTAPVRKWVDLVNSLFKTSQVTRSEAARLIKTKSDAFQRQRQEEARRAAEAARRAAEEQALRDAEIAAQMDDGASVDTILEIGAQAAADAEKSAKPELVRGDYGSTVGVRKSVRGEIDNVHDFLIAIANGQIPGVLFGDLISFKQAGLNSLARKVEAEGIKVPGFTAVVESTTNFR
jgi:hypothetical protein